MSATQTFLLELHCEEIPARFLKPLWEEFALNLAAEIAKWFPGSSQDHYWTEVLKGSGGLYSPRKLGWRIAGLPDVQSDQTETQVGPPQRMCVDEAGKPTIQGLKFAEKWGVDFSAVRFEQPAGKKEPCAVVTITKKGRPTMDLLAEALPGLIASLHVPKAMRWGRSEFEFVRPIRNILCLFGEQVVPITVDGVAATKTTWGHRLFHRQHPEPVTIATPEGYESALEAGGGRRERGRPPRPHRRATGDAGRRSGWPRGRRRGAAGHAGGDRGVPQDPARRFPGRLPGAAQGSAGHQPPRAPEELLHRESEGRTAALLPHRRQPPG